MCAEKNKTEAFIAVVWCILLWTTNLFARECSDAPPGASTQARCCIMFTGEASGGTFIFYKYLGGNAKCAIVETTAGEPAETVINRLADVIEERNPFDWIIVRSRNREIKSRVVTASRGELRGLAGSCGPYLIAGTETGLGIPQPPRFLTSNYDPDANVITFRWVNPSPNAYDSVTIVNRRGSSATLSGNSESYVFDLNKYLANMLKDMEIYNKLVEARGAHFDYPSDLLGDLDFWVFGEKNDIPSNAAAIRINRNYQEELFGIPFTSGIAPNWQSWSLDADKDRVLFQEGKREENSNVSFNPVSIVDANSFYQVISTGEKDGPGGVFRKFIGLTPGHTYRIKIRVAILSEPNEKQWSFSVHAAPNGPDGRDLSPRQMAGLETLPTGEKGNAASKMALYDSSLSTKGKFVEISTGRTVGGQENKDITLPSGADSITVWVRCAGSRGLSAAIDWISLEDLSVQKPY